MACQNNEESWQVWMLNNDSYNDIDGDDDDDDDDIEGAWL